MDTKETTQVIRYRLRNREVKDDKGIAQIDYTLNLPCEILTKIFNTLHEQFGTTNYDVAKLRQVCKRWCNVVDNNIDFYVHLNNQTFRGPTINHVRVSMCSVDDFYLTPPRNQRLFRDPKHIKQLSFNGKVSRKNFYWLINQITKLDNLSVNSRFLQHANVLLQPKNANEESTMNYFWDNINGIDCVAVKIFKCKNYNVPRTLKLILGAEMPNLKNVKIVAPWSLDFYSSLISFLLRHPSVSKIHLVLTDPKRQLNVHQANKPEVQNLEKIQVKHFLYSTHCGDKEGHLKIMSLIKGQRSLEELYFSSFTYVAIDVLDLIDFFRLNQSTLTSLTLSDIILHSTLDARIFQQLLCLKKLTLGLFGFDDDFMQSVGIPEISNLTSLPASLVELDLRNLVCAPDDLNEMLASKQSENLKGLYLYSVGNDIITPEFVDGLMVKKGMENFHLSPIDLNRFKVVVRNEKRFVVTKNGYLLPMVPGYVTLFVDLRRIETL